MHPRSDRQWVPEVIIVGAGRRGLAHISPWLKAGARVSGVVEPDATRAEATTRTRGLATFASLAEAGAALPATTIIDICTPPASHKDLTLQALHLGCHVLCEKPFVETPKEAEEVMALARALGRMVVVVHNWLGDPVMQATLRQVRQGKIGRVISGRCSCAFSYKRDPMGIAKEEHWVHRLRGGRLEETLPHLIYLLITVVNDPSLRLVSVSHRKETPFAWVKSDTLEAQLAGDNASASLFLTFATEVTSLRLDVVGSEKVLQAYFGTQYYELVGLRDARILQLSGQAQRGGELLIGAARRLSTAFGHAARVVTRRWPNGDKWLMREFVTCLQQGTEPPVRIEDAAATVRITHDIVETLNRDWAIKEDSPAR